MTILDSLGVSAASDGRFRLLRSGIPVDDIATAYRIGNGPEFIQSFIPEADDQDLATAMKFHMLRTLHGVRGELFDATLHPDTTNEREREEAWTFLHFAKAAKLALSLRPAPRPPPEPDLLVEIDGASIYFEIGEVLEQSFGEGLAYSRRQAVKKAAALAKNDTETAASIQAWGSKSFGATESLDRILQRKLANAYETREGRAELLLFYSSQLPVGPFNYLMANSGVYIKLLAKSAFSRIWLFHRDAHSVIGYLEFGAEKTLRIHYDVSYDFASLARR